MTMSNMEKQLPSNLFMRIHKSYIAALQKIDIINGSKVIILEQELPVSRSVKEKLLLAVDSKLIKR